jgi:hypothetical protein
MLGEGEYCGYTVEKWWLVRMGGILQMLEDTTV